MVMGSSLPEVRSPEIASPFAQLPPLTYPWLELTLPPMPTVQKRG